MVTAHYKNTLPGDSPELMPLDCHLFSDVNEGTARNVAFSFFLADDDPDKYSLATPAKVFDAIERTIASGCPSTARIEADIKRIHESTLDRIIDAKGGYIEDSARHGVRKEAQKAQKEQEEEDAAAAVDEDDKNRVDNTVKARFDALVDGMLAGGGVLFAKPQLAEVVSVDEDEEDDVEDHIEDDQQEEEEAMNSE